MVVTGKEEKSQSHPGLLPWDSSNEESREVSEWFKLLLLPMHFRRICPITVPYPPSNMGQLGNSQCEELRKGRGGWWENAHLTFRRRGWFEQLFQLEKKIDTRFQIVQMFGFYISFSDTSQGF